MENTICKARLQNVSKQLWGLFQNIFYLFLKAVLVHTETPKAAQNVVVTVLHNTTFKCEQVVCTNLTLQGFCDSLKLYLYLQKMCSPLLNLSLSICQVFMLYWWWIHLILEVKKNKMFFVSACPEILNHRDSKGSPHTTPGPYGPVLTSTSSSLKPITVRAFLTTFQSLRSLMELTLGQLPYKTQKNKQENKDNWNIWRIIISIQFKCWNRVITMFNPHNCWGVNDCINTYLCVM